MPTYEYVCDGCEYHEEVWHSIHEPHPEKCPCCGELYESGLFHQSFVNSNNGLIVYGTPTTIGQQAEMNARKLGKELCEKKDEEFAAAKAANRKRTLKDKLPEGVSIVPRPKKVPWYRAGKVGKLKKMEKSLNLAKVKDTAHYIKTGETQ